ncbi:MAG TPA: hypothetical protein VF755_11340, partial [Catenuloplanes sp.]
MSSPVTFPAPMDLHNLSNATLRRDPWTHAIVTDTFVNPDVTATLMGTYPTTGFTRLTQADSDKNFDMEARNDVTMRDLDDPCPWQTLLRQLNSPA